MVNGIMQKQPKNQKYKIMNTDSGTGNHSRKNGFAKAFEVLTEKDSRGGYTISIKMHGKRTVEAKIADVQNYFEALDVLKLIGNTDYGYAISFLKAAARTAEYQMAFGVVCSIAREGKRQESLLPEALMNKLAKWGGKQPFLHYLNGVKMELQEIKISDAQLGKIIRNGEEIRYSELDAAD